MRLLLDSHALIWAVDDPSRLGPQASEELAISTNQLFLIAGTVWEIAIKVGLKKLTLSRLFRLWINEAIADLGLLVLPITVDSADALISLPNYHRDPFDRLLAAQAQTEDIILISADVIFDQYDIQRIW